MLKDINGKVSPVVQLLWNCIAVHVHILQPSNSTLSHVPWRNLSLSTRRHAKECLLHFYNSKKQNKTQKLLSGSCPSTGKWLHFGIEYFTAVKKIELQLHVTLWISFRNKTFRGQIE